MMHKEGTIHGIDAFGRVVLPIRLRRRLHLNEGDAVQMWVENHALVIERVRESCIFCGEEKTAVTPFEGHFICDNCMKKIKNL